ncbi:MAG: hypothetical protein ABI232_04745, partial [Jatrophihabitantaceae bacterium]
IVEASTTVGTFVSMFPGTVPPAPLTSTVNFTPGRTVPNAAIVGVSGNRLGVYNDAGATQVAVDLFGYFRP